MRPVLRKVLRIVGVLAGLAAIVWLARDRFVSLPFQREDQPPAFGPPEGRPAPVPAPISPPPSVPDDLTEITGIGPVYAQRLNAAGIETFAQLAAADAATLSERIDVAQSRVADWIEQAARPPA